MGVDVPKDCQEVTVYTVRFIHGRGPVFYASILCAAETLNGSRASVSREKRCLVSSLWEQLVAGGSPFWKPCPSFHGPVFPIQVVHGRLGRPHLLLGEYRGPALSFSEGGGKVWAAICGDEADIGIDVAGADEFQSHYPFHRVFHPQELQHALRAAGGDLGNASALLWSIKEAVVKAMGCAFHLVDPRQITVYPSVGGGGEHLFPVSLSRQAMARLPPAAGRSLWVRSLPQGTTWLSIALLNGHLDEAMGGGGAAIQAPYKGKMEIHGRRN
jgi:phosphopantetheinyl transferase (holo-ACP synthase)